MNKLILISLILCVSLSLTKTNEINTFDKFEDGNWVTIKPSRSEVRAATNEIVYLECEASGSPQPQIYFFDEESDLENFPATPSHPQEHSKIALVKSVARLRFIVKKPQVIFCKASAGSKTAYAAIKISAAKSNLVREIWQQPNELNAPMITFFDAMYLEEVGNIVVLPCRSARNAKTNKIWLDSSGKPISFENERYSVTPSGDLKIENIEWSDLGEYTCVVKNNFGEDSVTTYLYPMVS